MVGTQVENLAPRREGKFITLRHETCMNLLKMAFEQRLVLVKGPPRSGKTSLLQLTADLAMHVEGVRRVFVFSAAAVSEAYTFETAWYKETGVDWTSACTPRYTKMYYLVCYPQNITYHPNVVLALVFVL